MPRRAAALSVGFLLCACNNAPQEVPVHEGLRTINGTELFVKRLGNGEPVVVVHGGPMLDHSYLLPHLASLAESFELVFFDQRLSGRSAGTVDSSSLRLSTLVDDIEALRESLELGRIHLLAHSWGGMLALQYAITHPHQLRSLILVSPMAASSRLWQQEEALLSARRTVEDSIELATIRSSNAFRNGEPDAIAAILVSSFKPQFADRSKVTDLKLFVPADYQQRSRQFGYLAGDLTSFDFHDELRDVPTRTLIVYGSEEPALELGGAALREHLPAAELVTIGEAGHFPFIEQSAAFLNVVTRFLGATVH